MARALWQGQVIAESGSYETVEGTSISRQVP